MAPLQVLIDNQSNIPTNVSAEVVWKRLEALVALGSCPFGATEPLFFQLEPHSNESTELSILELVEVNGTDMIKIFGRFWKKKLFKESTIGFHTFQKSGSRRSKREEFYVAVCDEASSTITSNCDEGFCCVQKDSKEHSQLQFAINKGIQSKLLRQRINTVPAVVTPTNHITPTNKDQQESASRSAKGDDNVLPHHNFFHNFEGTYDMQLAITNMYRFLRNCEENNHEIPAQLQSLIYDGLEMCADSTTKHSYKVKHCSKNGKMRFDQQMFVSIPKTRSKKGTNRETVLSRTKSMMTVLELFMQGDEQQFNAKCIQELTLKLSKLYQPECMEDEGASDHEDRSDSCYWKSVGAAKLFGYSSSYIRTEERDDEDDDEDDIESIIIKRIDRLQRVYTTPDGYKSVLSNKDKANSVSSYDRHQIELKSRYMADALTNALEVMPNGGTWSQCCDKALVNVNRVQGRDHFFRSRSIQDWHRKFRMDGETFDGFLSLCRKRVPRFLNDNPDEKQRILEYGRANLNGLTVESMREYIIETILPQMVTKRKEELTDLLKQMEADGNENVDEVEEELEAISIETILNENGLKILTPETVLSWMHTLGFVYKPRKKSYFVDAHEREDVVKDRHAFIKEFLDLEFRMHRWIQLEEDDGALQIMYGDTLTEEEGHKYISDDGITMIEFHVDDHKMLTELANNKYPFGGNLSVRRPADLKPLIAFGQDEAIMKQYQFTSRSWTGPNGEAALTPKDEGKGIMISALISREFGFGVQWTKDLADKVNDLRDGERYKDSEAAIAVYGSDLKGPLEYEVNPFIVKFEYGANADGYWNSNNMICQVENCRDVLKVLLNDHDNDYDIGLNIDHSQGHDKLRPDGLHVGGMNLGFGGVQRVLRPSELTSTEHFGPYPRTLETFYMDDCKFFYTGGRSKKKNSISDYLPSDDEMATAGLNVGDTQSMVFGPNDAGPFWLTAKERESKRHDRVLGKKKDKAKTKPELIEELESLGLTNVKGNKTHVVQLALRNGIDLKREVTSVSQGWEGKPKGKLQIAFERGLLDPTKKYEFYSEKGKKDAYGGVIEGSSIDEALQSCRDFAEEKTLLQLRAEEMGITVYRSPKCHPELAGYGIEYVWGVIKNEYRRLPLKEKKGKENFLKLVDRLVSRDWINTTVIRNCSARARAYVLAYRAKELYDLRVAEGANDEEKPTTYAMIEKLVKTYRSHRCTAEQDSGFITEIVKSMAQLSGAGSGEGSGDESDADESDGVESGDQDGDESGDESGGEESDTEDDLWGLSQPPVMWDPTCS